MRSSRTTTNSKESGTAMIESPVSVAQRAARDSSTKPTFQDLSTKFSGRFLGSLLPGGVESGWRFQRGSIDAFINGNRDFINYRLSCTIYQFQKNFACFPFRVMALEASPLRKQCESVDVSNPRRTRLGYLITLVPLHRVLFRREGKERKGETESQKPVPSPGVSICEAIWVKSACGIVLFRLERDLILAKRTGKEQNKNKRRYFSPR